ncbi:MAG TPA: hypothetical protein VHK91_09100 [Flavisolibacter sp.]|jgi:hypothetical protein|nr:hypothetical protein [Flavisolibacter sp.]
MEIEVKIRPLICLVLLVLNSMYSKSQDSTYVRQVDSLRASISWKDVKHKDFLIDSFKIQVAIKKSDMKISSILKKSKQPLLWIIFVYIDDRISKISPVGQQPFYILNDKLYYTKRQNYDLDEVELLIKKGYEYLAFSYEKLRRGK